MPNPKRRHSKARRDKRRAHDHLKAPGPAASARTATSPSCSHRVCPRCGYYKGKPVIGVEEV